MRELKRKCLICGKKLKIIIKIKGRYTGGHYFGKLEIPDIENWKPKVIRYTKIGKTKIGVVEDPPVKEIVENWECNKCFKER